MFYNLRYYSAIVLLVFVCLVVIIGLYTTNYSQKRIIQDISAQYAATHVEYFQNTIWERYFPIINFVAKDDKRDPSIIPSYMIFEKEMDNLFVKPEVLAAEFFNNGKLLYTSYPQNEPIDEADVVDATTNEREQSKIVKKLLNNGKKTYLYRNIYYPELTDLPDIYNQFAQNLEPQLIVYYDVDSKVKGFRDIIFAICGLFIISAVGAFAYMYIYSVKAEKLVEKGGGVGVKSISDSKASEVGTSPVHSQFFANFNHELRTPLNAIIGFSELIKNESMGPIENPKYKEFIVNIYESGLNLLALVDDARDFTQSSEDKLNLNAQEMNLTKITKLCMKMLESKMQEKSIDLDDQIPKTHYVISADPNRIKQVVLNLLSNAIQFNQDAGKITVRYIIDGEVGDKKRKITLEIKDTGLGMNPDELQRAMTPFGKTSESYDEDETIDSDTSNTNQATRDTSLGLPLTKQLVEKMGGKFDITSELNLGTTVRITFPLLAEEE